MMRLASQPMTPPMMTATMKPRVHLSLFEGGDDLFSSFQQVRHQPFTACVFQPVAIPDGQDRGGRNRQKDSGTPANAAPHKTATITANGWRGMPRSMMRG
jgi:hypothetical protein